jgi:hypothetical protein
MPTDTVADDAEPIAGGGKSVKIFSDSKRLLSLLPDLFLSTLIGEIYPMAIQQVSRAGNALVFPVVLCCLWSVAIPADAKAQKFEDATCTVQSVTRNGATTWQIKGAAKVTGLPAQSKSTIVKVKVRFQKKAKDAEEWSDISDVTITTAVDNDTAMIESGFRNFTPEPATGEKYRISLSGTWMNPGPPAKNGDLPGTDSPPITSVP